MDMLRASVSGLYQLSRDTLLITYKPIRPIRADTPTRSDTRPIRSDTLQIRKRCRRERAGRLIAFASFALALSLPMPVEFVGVAALYCVASTCSAPLGSGLEACQ